MCEVCTKHVPILIALITLIDVILYYFDIDFGLINYIAPNEPAITGYVGANQCGCPRVIPAATPAT